MTRAERFNQLYERYKHKAERQIAAGELTWTPAIMQSICRDCAEMHMANGPGNPVVYDDDITIDLPNFTSRAVTQTNTSHASLPGD